MPLLIPSERLGGVEMLTAAATSGIIGPFAQFKYLTIHVMVAGLSASAIPALRFGVGTTAAVDTGTTNYSDWNQPTSTSTTAGTAWGTNVIGSSQSMIRLDSAAGTAALGCTVEVMNRSSTLHTATWWTRPEGSVTTIARLVLGHASYTSASTGQITCVQLLSTVTTANLSVGSGFVVYGHGAA